MVLKALAVSGVVAAVLSVVAAFLLLRPAPATGLSAEPATLNAVVLPNGLSSPRLQPAQPASAPAFVNDAAPASLVSAEARLFAAEKPFSRGAQANEAVAAYTGCGN